MFLSISRSTLHPAVLYSESESGVGVEVGWVGRLVEGRLEDQGVRTVSCGNWTHFSFYLLDILRL